MIESIIHIINPALYRYNPPMLFLLSFRNLAAFTILKYPADQSSELSKPYAHLCNKEVSFSFILITKEDTLSL